MRATIILLFALFAGTVFAQAPVIDSMLIDEAKGILSVYGYFGAAQGKVWCDSVELPVLSWSASLVTATIPDTGKGSAGGVEIGAKGYRSKIRRISKWTYFSSSEADAGSGHWLRYETTKYRLSFRYDIESRIISHKFYMSFHGMRYSVDDYQYHDNATPQDPDIGRYDTDFRFTGEINLTNFTITFDQLCHSGIYAPDTLFQMCVAYLDSNLLIPTGGVSIRSNPTVGIFCNYFGEVTTLPDSSIINLAFSPVLIGPIRNADVDEVKVVLSWNALKYMDAYHIQLSKDSLINGQHAGQAQQGVAYIVDTIVSSLDFTLPPLEKNTKYYWHVCGVNSEGESRWSDVWSFTTGTSTDVKQEQVKSISLACYPNPATSELTIVTTEPTRLLLYDVTGKIIKSEQMMSNQMKWDVSLLPNGTYILGTSSGEMQVVQIVK